LGYSYSFIIFVAKSAKEAFLRCCACCCITWCEKEALLKDIRFLGFLFESLVIHELLVYTQVSEAKVYYYQDSSGLEVNATVQKYNGDWCAFEFKLGTGQIEKAAKSLKKFVSILDAETVQCQNH
jgi:hypothetical protein